MAKKLYLSKEALINDTVIIRLLIQENKNNYVAIAIATNKRLKTWGKSNPIKPINFKSIGQDKEILIKYLNDIIINILYQEDPNQEKLINELLIDLENKINNDVVAAKVIEEITNTLEPPKAKKFNDSINYAINCLEVKEEIKTSKPRPLINKIEHFLNTVYKSEVLELLNNYPDKKYLIIDYEKLEREDWTIADQLIEDPQTIINHFKMALDRLNYTNNELNINIRFKNINDYKPLKYLLNDKIGQLIETKGIIKGLGTVKAEPYSVIFECLGCGRLHEVKQPDNINNIVKPAICNECGGRTFQEIPEESKYNDIREVIIEEIEEDLTKTTKPRRLLVKLENDLLYNINTGDKVKLTGSLNLYKPTNAPKQSKINNYMIKANYIENTEDEKIILSNEDIAIIKELSKKEDIIELLTNSLAPNLIIPNEIKKAMLCYIVRGIVPIKNDGEPIERDYINIMIISDPATAKTKLGRTVINLCEKGITTNGATSTGVGLSGAVIRDEITGAFMVEAGAIPLANGGNCLIDEFDKLERTEQFKLLNYMESGEDTITKAGLHETLKGRTGLLLLANPKFGRFDRYKSTIQQVNIYAPVLSRCDLTFILEDVPNYEKDLKIAKANLNNYLESENDNINNSDVLDNTMLKKYLKYAKSFKPVLIPEAIEYLSNYYATVRNNNTEELAIPLDSRALNSIYRLAGAIAKLKLKSEININDCKEAIKLKEYSLKNAGYDPETNTIDSGRVYGEGTNADKINRSKVLGILINWANSEENLTPEYMPKSQLLETFKQETGKEQSTFYNVFNQLKNAGDIKEIKGKVYINPQYLKNKDI